MRCFEPAASSPTSDLMALRFDLSTCGAGDDEATAETIVRLRPDGTAKRKYRRTREVEGPAHVPQPPRSVRSRVGRGLPVADCSA